MTRIGLCSAAIVLAVLAGSARPEGQSKPPLVLMQTIPMPQVKGRMDHLWVDTRSRRLFVAALESGSVEIVDLQSGRWLQSIPGFKKPQGILYLPRLHKLFVASGDDGMLRVFDGKTYRLLDAIKLDRGANRIAIDPARHLLYVGYGGKDAGQDHGEIAAIDPAQDKVVATFTVDAHPAELLVDASGAHLFALIPAQNEVEVIDPVDGKTVERWPVSSKSPGDAALDPSLHTLLIGTHTPPSMVAMDFDDGKELASLPTTEGMDGVYFDSRRRRVYVSGGRGFDVGSIFVYQQTSAQQYKNIGVIPTRAGAGTSYWSADRNRYYVAAPAHDQQPASVLVFRPQP